jgi:hypothetical protein
VQSRQRCDGSNQLKEEKSMIKKFGLAMLAVGLLTVPSLAQGTVTYGDKLGFMPISNANRPKIGGTGEVSATLNGTTLAITGSYSGLKGDATTLAVHSAPPGMVGPEIASIDIAGTTSGDFSGEVELSSDQVALLEADSLYVVVKTAGNETGELRAWLMAKGQ